jgi:hypothetical protein
MTHPSTKLLQGVNNMEKEFSNTDAELARCIKSRLRYELGLLPHNKQSEKIVREYILELTREIINEPL